MNKGKLIDADKLKEAINGFGNLIPKFVLDLIDELSEDREDEKMIKTKEEILDDLGVGEIPFSEMVTMYYPAILSAMEEYAKQVKHIRDVIQPNPLKVAIKGDGTEEYSKVIFQYFSSHTIKGLHDVDSFEQEAYYFIENNELVFSLNLPEGYTEISLKEKKPTGLMLDLKRRVEAIEKQSNRWYDKFQKQKINYREAIERVEELETELTEIKLKLKDLSK